MAPESILPTARPRIAARARLQTDKITGKPVLLYPEGALLLNPTAQAIIALCTGHDTVSSIVTNLADRYQTPDMQVSIQVTRFLNRLRAKNLVDFV